MNIINLSRKCFNFFFLSLGVFIHSSLRLRNLKNKLTTTVETIGIKHSPMGQFLEAMGLMPDTFQ